MFPLSSIFFLLYAAESSCKSSCRVLPQVFSSPLSLKSNAGKSSCTSVPQNIHPCARQTWKETFSDSVKKKRKTMLRAPNVNQGNNESPFLQIFQAGKVFVNFSAAKILNLYFCWQCHCKNWVGRIKENALRRKSACYNVLHKILFIWQLIEEDLLLRNLIRCKRLKKLNNI